MKKEKVMLITKSLLALIIIVGLIFILDKKILEDNKKDIDWIRKNVNIVEDKSLGKNIYKIQKDEK